MSIESAKALYSRLLTDQAFRVQLEQAISQEERLQIVRTAGYDYTPEELETAKTQILESSATNDELSEADLEAVTGGSATVPFNFPFIPVAAYGVVMPGDSSPLL